MNDRPTIYVIGGTCGTGKSTIAERVHQRLHENNPKIEFIEGDLLHPAENIRKMSHGIPLHDDDRWGWLEKVSDDSYKKSEECDTCIVTCSSLKKSYRDYIRSKHPEGRFVFFMLYGAKSEILKRILQRESHFMKADMVDSQFNDLQLPAEDEQDSFVINVTSLSVEEVVDEIMKKINASLS